jgi:MipA family protein
VVHQYGVTRNLHWSKFMPRTTTRITCFALSLLAVATAGAADQGPPPDGNSSDDPTGYSWGLGVAGFTQQQSYTGIDRMYAPIPLIHFENRWVELMGPWLDFKLPSLSLAEDQELKFTLRTQLFGFDGYKAKDAPILNGMATRKNGIFGGPTFKWSTPVVDVFGEGMFDLSGNSKGKRMSMGIERQFHVGERLMFTPSATAIWLDKKYADYYYGVRAAEVRSGRPAYVAGSTVNTEVSLRADYFLDEHQAVFMQLGYTALGSKIKDSPLTSRSGETMAFVGYLYRFR